MNTKTQIRGLISGAGSMSTELTGFATHTGFIADRNPLRIRTLALVKRMGLSRNDGTAPLEYIGTLGRFPQGEAILESSLIQFSAFFQLMGDFKEGHFVKTLNFEKLFRMSHRRQQLCEVVIAALYQTIRYAEGNIKRVNLYFLRPFQ